MKSATKSLYLVALDLIVKVLNPLRRLRRQLSQRASLFVRCDIAEEGRTHTPCGEQFLRLWANLVLQDRHLASTHFD